MSRNTKALVLTKKEKTDAIKSLSGALKAWGPKGEFWIQGSWADEVEIIPKEGAANDEELGYASAYCLMGGLDRGLYGTDLTEDVPEEISQIVAQEIWKIHPRKQKVFGELLKKDGTFESPEGVVIGFNDSAKTTFKQVHKVVCSSLKRVLATRAVSEARALKLRAAEARRA